MDTVSGRGWGDVEAVGDLGRVVEVFVQGVDVFEHAATAADDEIVDCDDVLGVFGEGDAADMLPQ